MSSVRCEHQPKRSQRSPPLAPTTVLSFYDTRRRHAGGGRMGWTLRDSDRARNPSTVCSTVSSSSTNAGWGFGGGEWNGHNAAIRGTVRPSATLARPLRTARARRWRWRSWASSGRSTSRRASTCTRRASCSCRSGVQNDRHTISLIIRMMRAHTDIAPKGEPLARETASKRTITILSWPHERFFSSLVFATFAEAPLSAWQCVNHSRSCSTYSNAYRQGHS